MLMSSGSLFLVLMSFVGLVLLFLMVLAYLIGKEQE